MKIIMLLFFPICLFAQTEVQNDELKNKLLISFNQPIGYFDSTYKQDLSLEENNKLIQDDVLNYKNRPTTISPLNPTEERIEYRYDDTVSRRENFVKSIVHELFFSKPLKLGK